MVRYSPGDQEPIEEQTYRAKYAGCLQEEWGKTVVSLQPRLELAAFASDNKISHYQSEKLKKRQLRIRAEGNNIARTIQFKKEG